MSDRPVAKPLPKYTTTQTQKNAHTPNIHARSGIEPTITASERAKTIATVTGVVSFTFL
jgi:hypothetical protein